VNKKGSGPSDAFLQCLGCKKILFSVEFKQNLRVCPHCGFHHRLSASERIEITFDPGSFREVDADLRSIDTLEFPDYAAKLAQAEERVDRFDSVVCGEATIMEHPVSVAIGDFAFMGGSMGSVAGEKVARTLERAIDKRMPAIVFTASGGARMQEGLLSLMQMAKTTAAVQRCAETRTPYICVLTDPTTGGVLASYASIADVILAEPQALIAFAGARVSKQAGVGGRVPDDFQSSEFALAHGMIDRVVVRKELRSVLGLLVGLLGGADGR